MSSSVFPKIIRGKKNPNVYETRGRKKLRPWQRKEYLERIKNEYDIAYWTELGTPVRVYRNGRVTLNYTVSYEVDLPKKLALDFKDYLKKKRSEAMLKSKDYGLLFG
jgi:hypothetical protein